MNYNLEAGIGSKSYRVPKRAWMIAFAIGWGLLTILVVMQDHAIDTQRELIQLLMGDLHTALRTTVSHSTTSPLMVKQDQLPSAQIQTMSAPSVQVPLHPSTQVQPNVKGSSRAPSSQGKMAVAKPGRSSRLAAKPLPVAPPAQFTDPSDMRRVTFSI
jgi:hypothetical protein